MEKSRSKGGHGGARKGAGAPRKALTRMTRRNVMLDDATVAKALKIGGGNLSAGIREAVKRVSMNG